MAGECVKADDWQGRFQELREGVEALPESTDSLRLTKAMLEWALDDATAVIEVGALDDAERILRDVRQCFG